MLPLTVDSRTFAFTAAGRPSVTSPVTVVNFAPLGIAGPDRDAARMGDGLDPPLRRIVPSARGFHSAHNDVAARRRGRANRAVDALDLDALAGRQLAGPVEVVLGRRRGGGTQPH